MIPAAIASPCQCNCLLRKTTQVVQGSGPPKSTSPEQTIVEIGDLEMAYRAPEVKKFPLDTRGAECCHVMQ